MQSINLTNLTGKFSNNSSAVNDNANTANNNSPLQNDQWQGQFQPQNNQVNMNNDHQQISGEKPNFIEKKGPPLQQKEPVQAVNMVADYNDGGTDISQAISAVADPGQISSGSVSQPKMQQQGQVQTESEPKKTVPQPSQEHQNQEPEPEHIVQNSDSQGSEKVNNNEIVERQQPLVTEPQQLPQSVNQPNSNESQVLRYQINSESQLDDYLSLTIDKNASDLHLSVGYPPIVRINGDLARVPVPPLSQDKVEEMFMSLLTTNQKEDLAKNLDIDFSYSHPSNNRFRVNLFYRQGLLAGAFRLIPSKIKTIGELGLPSLLESFTGVANGLVLVTGPTGSGKSTTLAAIINEINMTRPKHIITLEDAIEYVFPKSKALINQRELGLDVRNWKRGLREVLREDPDVVLVGEMRDYETIALTITTAETGHLVFSTLHTNSASQTIDRIIDVFPDSQQAQIRAQLATVIHAVVSQRLVPVKSGGRRAVTEIMIATPGIKNAIREKKTHQIDNMIQTGSELGMVSLEASLVKLIREGEITIDQAQQFTTKHNELISLLKQN